jgi:hypothetical protein
MSLLLFNVFYPKGILKGLDASVVKSNVGDAVHEGHGRHPVIFVQLFVDTTKVANITESSCRVNNIVVHGYRFATINHPYRGNVIEPAII